MNANVGEEKFYPDLIYSVWNERAVFVKVAWVGLRNSC